MKKNKGTPREPKVRYHFKNAEYDFFLQWIQGAQTFGGAEGGECFYTASRIKEGDPESWVNEWTSMAKRVAARGEKSLENGHEISASQSFLRAYIYYRAGLLYISPLDELERYKKEYEVSQNYFKKAARLMPDPLLEEKISFEDYYLPAYYKPAANGKIAPTLIMIGGGDTFVEDLYPYIGPAAHKRDWNIIMVDFPGQGILPYYGKTWRADAEKPMSAVIDHLLKKPEVDPDAIMTYGISGGGYLVPRAAAYEKRLAGSAACSALLDLTAAWNRNYTDLCEKAEKSIFYRLIKKWLEIKHKAYVVMVDTYVWRMGAENPQGLVEATKDCVVDPKLITTPFLNISSEQEVNESQLFNSFAEKIKKEASNSLNKNEVLPANEGADSHAIGTNLSLMSQVLFDWFEDVLREKD